MRFSKNRLIGLALIILSSSFMAACGDSSDLKTQGKNVINQLSGKDKKQEESNKYNKYVEFYNDGLNDIYEEVNTYIQNMGQDPNLNKEEAYTIGSSYSKWDEIKKLPQEAPAMQEFDDIAKELIPVAENLDQLLTSAREYYKAKDYKDDQYAKGQELHTKILAEINKFESLYSKFNQALENRQRVVRAEQMEQAKKEGDEMRYNLINVATKMDKILDELNAEKISAANVLSTDLTKIKPLYEEYNQAQKALRDAVNNAKNKDELENVERYVEKTTEFKLEVINLIDRVENKKTLSNSEVRYPRNVDGTPEKLADIQQSATSRYNRMH